MNLDEVLILDTETDVLENPYPIQVCFKRLNNDIFHNLYFKPVKRMEFGAIAVHGVTHEEANRRASEFYDIGKLPTFSVLIGHNIPFDIKASEFGAHKKNEHLRYVTDSIGLYSGFLDEDFGNGFRASQSATDRQVERYTRALDEGVTRLAKAS